jgi:hypothetical protein
MPQCSSSMIWAARSALPWEPTRAMIGTNLCRIFVIATSPPHVARKCQGSAVDGRTTRHVGYSISIRVRKRIESIFGWMKTVGGMRKTRFRGLDRVGLHFTLVSTAYNLVRMARLGVA